MKQLNLPLKDPTYQLWVEIDQHEDNGQTFYEEYLVGQFGDKREAYDHCASLNSLGTRGSEYKVVVVWSYPVLDGSHETSTDT